MCCDCPCDWLSAVAAAWLRPSRPSRSRSSDLYLVGHGHAGIDKEIVTGLHLSASDLILIGAVLLTAAGAWTISRPKR
jgi:hypothetical protein